MGIFRNKKAAYSQRLTKKSGDFGGDFLEVPPNEAAEMPMNQYGQEKEIRSNGGSAFCGGRLFSFCRMLASRLAADRRKGGSERKEKPEKTKVARGHDK